MKAAWVQRLSGVHVASATPYVTTGVLDVQGVCNLVDYYAESGLQGAFFPSSTGESFSMPREERVRVVRLAAEQARGRIVILANASESSWQETVAQTKAMADAGADAAVCMPPTFFQYTQEELRDFFYRIADESPLPVVVYNHLVRLPNKILLPLVMELRKHENIVGIKDTHNDAARLLHLYAQGAQKDFAILCGGDGMAGYSALLGMGMLNALSALKPKLFLNLYQAGRAQDLQRVALLQEEVNKLMGIFTAAHGGAASASLFGQAIKAALYQKSLCGCAAAQMGFVLTQEDHARVKALMDSVREDV